MLLLLLAVVHGFSMLFLDAHVPAIVWAGAFAGQGAYSGGRLISDGIGRESRLLGRIQAQALSPSFRR